MKMKIRMTFTELILDINSVKNKINYLDDGKLKILLKRIDLFLTRPQKLLCQEKREVLKAFKREILASLFEKEVLI